LNNPQGYFSQVSSGGKNILVEPQIFQWGGENL